MGETPYFNETQQRGMPGDDGYPGMPGQLILNIY